MLNDHVHFKIKEGIIFTTRGFYHQKNKVRAVPLYRPISEGLEKNIDEFGDKWFYQIHPEWIQDSIFGKGIFVPTSHIIEVYDPFESAEKIIRRLEDETAKHIITFLEKIGVNKKDIGFLGSYLVNTRRKPHDVDFIIRGLDNLILIRKNFKELLSDIHGKNFPTEEYVIKSVLRYEQKYNSTFNDFKEIIARRWPTIYVPNKFFGKLRFTYRSDEVPILKKPKGKALNNISISGEVIDDLETSFMPRQFKLKCANKQIKVLTYFWDYAYCVKVGDKVTVRGNYFPKSRLILICNPKQHGIKFS